MDLYDIIGPVMIGPSSSHTAGAAKIGRAARLILGDSLERAIVTLYGSFAKTGTGHGTDKAIIAGLLGLMPDDVRLRDADKLARQSNVEISIQRDEAQEAVHPNTAKIEMWSRTGHAVVIGESVGGGHIVITEIDGLAVHFSGELYTLLVLHRDRPGSIAAVSVLLEREKINVASMSSTRSSKGGEALMILETDQPVPPEVIESIGKLSAVIMARSILPL